MWPRPCLSVQASVYGEAQASGPAARESRSLGMACWWDALVLHEGVGHNRQCRRGDREQVPWTLHLARLGQSICRACERLRCEKGYGMEETITWEDLPRFMAEVRVRARSLLKSQQQFVSLQPTELVDSAVRRLLHTAQEKGGGTPPGRIATTFLQPYTVRCTRP